MRNSPQRRTRALLAAGAAAAAAFAPCVLNGLVSLDGNDHFLFGAGEGAAAWWRWRWIFGSSFFTGNYEPLHWLVLASVRALGAGPWGYHLAALAAHAAASALLALLLLELGLSAPAAAAGAALFAVHPLRTEAVAWVTAQHYPLAAALALGAAILYLRRRLGASLALFAASLLALPAAMTLPLVLLALDAYPLGRLPADPRRWLSPEARPILAEKLPYLALCAASAAAILAARAVSRNLLPLSELGPAARLLLAAHGAWFCLAKTAWPAALSPVYELPYPVAPARWLGEAAALTALTAIVVAARRRAPAALAAWACFLLLLLPVSGLATSGTQAAADRYSYFPAIALSAGAAAGVEALARTRARAALAAAPGLLFVLLPLSWRQCRVWRDSGTLWDHVLCVDPANATARVGRGYALLAQGRLDEAASLFAQAAGLNGRLVAPYYALGWVRERQGRSAEALALFAETLRRDPAFAAADNALGSELARTGRLKESLPYFEKAVALRPDHARTRFNLALALSELGDADGAAAQYREALALEPGFSEARANLRALLAAQRR